MYYSSRISGFNFENYNHQSQDWSVCEVTIVSMILVGIIITWRTVYNIHIKLSETLIIETPFLQVVYGKFTLKELISLNYKLANCAQPFFKLFGTKMLRDPFRIHFSRFLWYISGHFFIILKVTSSYFESKSEYLLKDFVLSLDKKEKLNCSRSQTSYIYKKCKKCQDFSFSVIFKVFHNGLGVPSFKKK